MSPAITKSRILRDLLDELRDGLTFVTPVLVELDVRHSNVGESTIDTTLTAQPANWLEQYGREYAANPYVILYPRSRRPGAEPPRVSIGRSRECDIRIENDSVSKLHASVICDDTSGEYLLVDEHSRNGTYLNDLPLEPGVPAALWAGAYLRFGDALFVFIDAATLQKLAALVYQG